MQKKFYRIVFLVVMAAFVQAQPSDVKRLIEQGAALHDEGNYVGAIEKYQEALRIDKNSALANYEISSSYFASKEYEKAIRYSDVLIAGKMEFSDQAYIVKGSALDMMEKPKEAVKSYKEGIREFPKNYLLHYNLAYTYYNMRDVKATEEALQHALRLNPEHASSHLLLGFLMSDKGNRVKSLLALYNFLLLEPKGKRATSAYELVQAQLKQGVKKDTEKNTTITLSDTKESDEFRAAELMLSLTEAAKGLEKNENKNQYELFSDQTKSFFTVLGELKNKNKGFWWDFYVDFFYTLTEKSYAEPLSYYISQSLQDDKINSWMITHKDQVDALSAWYAHFTRK